MIFLCMITKENRYLCNKLGNVIFFRVRHEAIAELLSRVVQSQKVIVFFPKKCLHYRKLNNK
jgi:hypothetical protein